MNIVNCVNTKNERNYGIDLLRMVLMYMVCMLHVLGQGGVLNTSSAKISGGGYKVFWLLEILCYCAVDGFALISGYMATDKPRRYERIVEMWFQAFFYSFIVTLVFTVFGINKGWNIIDVVKCALPVGSAKFWYFTAYFVLFFAMPVLNKFIFTIDINTAKKALIILVILFSVIGTVRNDPFVTQKGYSAFWLIVLYCIGALAKKVKLFEKRKTIILISLWMACGLITWSEQIFVGKERLTSYVSPTVLLSGMIMVVLFSRIRLKGTIISNLSPLVFGVYLFQLNQVVYQAIIKERFAFIASQNIIVGVLEVFAFAMAIFIAGLIVETVRNRLAKWMRIPEFSKKIVKFVSLGLSKMEVLLK